MEAEFTQHMTKPLDPGALGKVLATLTLTLQEQSDLDNRRGILSGFGVGKRGGRIGRADRLRP